MEDCGFQILSFLLHLEISGTLNLRVVGEKQDFTAAVGSQDTVRFECNEGQVANSKQITLTSKILLDFRENLFTRWHARSGLFAVRINVTVWVQIDSFT